MPKREAFKLTKEILFTLQDKSTTPSKLEKRLNTSFRTIKDHCKELEALGQIKKEIVEKHPANGRPSVTYKITDEGRKSVDRIKKLKF